MMEGHDGYPVPGMETDETKWVMCAVCSQAFVSQKGWWRRICLQCFTTSRWHHRDITPEFEEADADVGDGLDIFGDVEPW